MKPNPRAKTLEQLGAELVELGGTIVPSDECPDEEFEQAKNEDRFALSDRGQGFVHRPREGVNVFCDVVSDASESGSVSPEQIQGRLVRETVE